MAIYLKRRTLIILLLINLLTSFREVFFQDEIESKVINRDGKVIIRTVTNYNISFGGDSNGGKATATE